MITPEVRRVRDDLHDLIGRVLEVQPQLDFDPSSRRHAEDAINAMRRLDQDLADEIENEDGQRG